nr:MAG TPA: hypothetical protein [Caudoviricetes sp.]
MIYLIDFQVFISDTICCLFVYCRKSSIYKLFQP